MNEFKSFMDNSQSFVAPKLGYNVLVGSQICFNAGSELQSLMMAVK